MDKEIKVSDIPDGVEVKDLPEGTIIVLDDLDAAIEDKYWEDK